MTTTCKPPTTEAHLRRKLQRAEAEAERWHAEADRARGAARVGEVYGNPVRIRQRLLCRAGCGACCGEESMIDYTDWDRRIIGAIDRDGPSFATICVRLGLNPKAGGDSPPWRIVDRRLQAMRKQGRIACEKGKWRAVERG